MYRVDIPDAVRKRAPAPTQVRKAPEQAAPAASEVEETESAPESVSELLDEASRDIDAA